MSRVLGNYVGFDELTIDEIVPVELKSTPWEFFNLTQEQYENLPQGIREVCVLAIYDECEEDDGFASTYIGEYDLDNGDKWDAAAEEALKMGISQETIDLILQCYFDYADTNGEFEYDDFYAL